MIQDTQYNPKNILSLPWGSLAYGDTGSKLPALVFLHGAGCDSGDWNNVIDKLPSDRRIVAVDFRGHGQSSVPVSFFTLQNLADDVSILIGHLGISDVVLVGHSLGGMVAMETARFLPAVKGLVLVEGWTSLSASHAFGHEHFYGNLPEEAIQKIKEKFNAVQLRCTAEIWGKLWKSVESFDAFSFLSTVRIPVFEVYGSKGRTEETREKLLVPENPAIQLVWVPETGHFSHYEKPAEFAEICQKMLVRI